MANQAKVIVHSADEILNEILLVDGTVTTIPAEGGVTYEVKELTDQIAPEELVVKRKGDDLELYLGADSAAPDAVIPDYYLLEEPSPLVGLAEDGQFYSYVPQSGEASLLPWNMEEGDSSYQSLGYDTAGSAVPWWPILLAGLLVGGGIAAASSSSSSSSGGGAVDNEAPLPPGNLDVSDDGTTVTGTGEPGTEAEVTDPNGDVIGSGTVDENGDFEVDINPPQTDGEDLEVTLEDDAGNNSDPGKVTAPDTTAPDAPDDLVVSEEGDTVTGTGEPGTKVEVMDPDGTVIGDGTVDENGDFQVELEPPQTDGEDLEVTLEDDAGNTSDPGEVTAPDTTAPDAPVINAATDDVGDVTGELASGDSTDDTTPTLSGTAEANSTVTVFQDGNQIGTTEADGSGDWRFDVPDLVDGDHSFTATATDAAGNESDKSASFDLTVDTTAPETGDGSNSIAFDDGGDGLLNASEANNTTLSGQVEAGAIVDSIEITDGTKTVIVDAGNIGVSDSGNVIVSGQDLSSLEDGELTVTMTVSDESGNTGMVENTTTLDTTAPTVSVDDQVTNDTTPTLTGTVDDKDAEIIVTVDGSDYTTDNNGDGTWTLADDALPALNEGDTPIVVTATDPAGNSSTDSATVTVDTKAPGDDSNNIAFDDGGDGLLNDSEASSTSLSGQVEAGASVDSIEITDGTDTVAVAAADITTDGSGAVTVAGQDLSGLADGDLTVTMTVSDEAGNTGTVENTTTLDTTAPTVSVDDLVTNDTTPALTGTVGDKSAQITVTVDGTEYPATNNGDGTWILAEEIQPALSEAEYDITVTATDPAGNEGTGAGTVNVDTSVPNITFDTLVTNDTTPELTGSVSDNSAAVTVTVDETEYTAINNGDGTWTLADNTLPELSEGNYTVTASAKTPSGSPGSTTGQLTIDTTPPDVTVDETNGAELTGTAEAGSTVDVDVDGDGTPDHTTEADSDGNWAVTPGTPLDDGTDVNVTATDDAGNISDPVTVTVDGAAPDAPTIDAATDDVGDITGELASGDSTDDTTPTLSGSAEANSTVTVFQNGNQVGTTEADGSGDWHYEVTDPVDEGDHSFTATATDEVGNQSGQSPSFDLTVDTTAPETGDGNNSIAFDDGGDGLLNASEANNTTLSGQVEVGATVDSLEITDGTTTRTVAAADITVGSDGTVTISGQDLNALADGELTATMTVSDAAGNTGSVTNTVTMDTTPPEPSNLATAHDETSDTVTVTGNGETGAGVEVLDKNGNVVGTGQVQPDGSFAVELDDASSAKDGEELDVTLTDDAGNTTDPAAPVDAPDVTAPDAPGDLAVSDDGTTVTGTGEPGTQFEVTDPSGNVIGSGTVDESGNFQSDLEPPQTDAENLGVTLKDEAGNSSDPGAVTAPDVDNIFAAGNAENLTIDAIPTETDETAIDETVGSAVDVAAGGVANVDLAKLDQAIAVDVIEGTERELTLEAIGGGLDVGGELDLLVFKENKFGTYDLQDEYTEEGWITSVLAGTSAYDANFTLPEGNYRIALGRSGGVNIASGYTVTSSVHKTLDYNNPVEVSGEVSGNVINDNDAADGVDYVNGTTTVKSVTDSSGSAESVAPGTGQVTTIQGDYGTLIINSRGEYTYTIDDDTEGSVLAGGATESFEYTIHDPNVPGSGESTANLIIQIGRDVSGEPIVVDDVLVPEMTDPVPEEGPSKGDSISDVGLVGVGLGPVLDADVLPDIENRLNINVDEGTTRDITFDASGGGLGIGQQLFNLLVLRKDEDTGKFVQVHTEEDWYEIIGAVAAVGSADALTLTLPEGEYVAFLQGQNIGLDIASGTTFEITEDVLTDYNAAEVTGTKAGSIEDAAIDEMVSVNGTKLDGSGSVDVAGDHGTLTVNSDGTYTYTLNSLGESDPKPYGETESFLYVYREDGEIKTGRFNLKIGMANAVDDTIDYTIDMENRVETVLDESYSNAQIASQEVNHNFTLDENTTSVITMDISANNVGAGNTTLFYELAYIDGSGTRQVVATDSQSSGSPDFGQIVLDSTNPAIVAGDYELKVTSSQVLANQVRLNVDINVESTYDNEYQVQNLPVEEGNLFDNDAGAEHWSEIAVNSQQMYLDTNGTDTALGENIEIVGEYGALTLSGDGSYSYEAFGTDVGTETFDYTLTTHSGDESTGQIVINVDHNAPDGQTYPWSEEDPGSGPAGIQPMSLSFENLTTDEESNSDEQGAEPPSLDSLVESSETLSFEGEAIAGSGAEQPVSVVDASAPLADPSRQEDDDDTAAAVSVV